MKPKKLSVSELLGQRERGGPQMSTMTDVRTGTRLTKDEAAARGPISFARVAYGGMKHQAPFSSDRDGSTFATQTQGFEGLDAGLYAKQAPLPHPSQVFGHGEPDYRSEVHRGPRPLVPRFGTDPIATPDRTGTTIPHYADGGTSKAGAFIAGDSKDGQPNPELIITDGKAKIIPLSDLQPYLKGSEIPAFADGGTFTPPTGYTQHHAGSGYAIPESRYLAKPISAEDLEEAQQRRAMRRVSRENPIAYLHLQQNEDQMDRVDQREVTQRGWMTADRAANWTREDQQRADEINRTDSQRRENRDWMTADQAQAYQRQDQTRNEERRWKARQDEADRQRKRNAQMQVVPIGQTGYGIAMDTDGNIHSGPVPLQPKAPAPKDPKIIQIPDPGWKGDAALAPRIPHQVITDPQTGQATLIPVQTQGSPQTAPSAPQKTDWRTRITPP